ncbi:MAG: aminotransferase class I/II-fold pyridoxal phosphate-dependent enzyme [Acidobacteriota bacterium]|nr:aminotransferase class I/II-fold pyridoxal phosphate-dependent enzyme [Acidobacteriota bacterium]
MRTEGQRVRTSKRVENVTYAVREVVDLAHQAAAAGRDMIYLNIGDPCQFDFRTPEVVVDAIVRALADGKTGYAPSDGVPEALQAIRRDAEVRKGIRSVRHVLIGNGASEPIEILLTALVDPGESVLIPSPGYPLYSAILAKIGARAVSYDLDEDAGWQPDPQQIARLADGTTRAVVLIHPNNPTGSVASRATLESVLEVAASRRLVVLSDEIYDRMLLDPVEFVSTASLRDDVPIATFGGLSKVWLGPGLRMGWSILSGPAVAVEPLHEAMMRLARARLSASHPVQWAIRPALEEAHTHIDDVNARLRSRRDLLVRELERIPGWSLVPPRAAFYAFPRVEIGVDDETLVRELILEHGVVLVHGSGFGQLPGTNHARIVFLPPDELIAEACRRLADYSAGRG